MGELAGRQLNFSIFLLGHCKKFFTLWLKKIYISLWKIWMSYFYFRTFFQYSKNFFYVQPFHTYNNFFSKLSKNKDYKNITIF